MSKAKGNAKTLAFTPPAAEFSTGICSYITINGKEYAAPFMSLWHPLTPEERAGLKARIKKRGIIDPILLYSSPKFGEAIIDGINRAEIALELRIDAFIRHLGKMSDQDAYLEAKSANRDRRQSSRAQLAAVARKRVDEVLRLTVQRLSTRAIAQHTGKSQTQVRRDQARAKASTVGDKPAKTTEPHGSPARVKGLDGKEHPARKPAKPKPAITHGPEPTEPPGSPARTIVVNATTIPGPEAYPGDPPSQRAGLLATEDKGIGVGRASMPIQGDPSEWADIIPPKPEGKPDWVPGTNSFPAILAEIRAGKTWIWARDCGRVIEAIGIPWSEIERLVARGIGQDPDTGRTKKRDGLPVLEPLLPDTAKAALKRNREAAKGATTTPDSSKVLEALARRKKASSGIRDEEERMSPYRTQLAEAMLLSAVPGLTEALGEAYGTTAMPPSKFFEMLIEKTVVTVGDLRALAGVQSRKFDAIGRMEAALESVGIRTAVARVATSAIRSACSPSPPTPGHTEDRS